MLILLGLCCAGLALSCDTTPPAPPSTAAAEVARIPLAEISGQLPTGVISIAPDGKRIAVRVRTKNGSSSSSGGAGDLADPFNPTDAPRIYDVAQKQLEAPSLPVPAHEELVAVHFSPDGRFIVGLYIGSRPHRELRVFRTQDLGEMFATQTDLHGLAPITFSPDGKSLAFPTPPDEKGRFALMVVNVVSGAPRATLPIEFRAISRGVFRGMAFTPDGNYVYGHQAKHIFIWNVASGTVVTEWNWMKIGDVAAMGCTPDSSNVRAVMEDGTIANIDLPAANNVRTTRLDVPPVPNNQPPHVAFQTAWSFNRAAFATDGGSVLRDAGGRIDVFELQTGKFSRIIALPSGAAQVNVAVRQGDFVPVQVQDAAGGAIVIVQLPK
jgi:WD40 repeat protein